MKKWSSTLLLGLIALSIACSAGVPRTPRTSPPTLTAQGTAAELDLSAEIPLDPAVRHGRLRNGLSYFVHPNYKPAGRAELRLVVNAGSVLEDDDQRGLFHFVEHMAFNGTKHFAKQELIDYLERSGMRFGPDINAYTSLDETVYMLEIPTDEAKIVRTAFQILEDWAHGLSFAGEEIDKERGVVVEEWRLGRGAAGRIRDKQFPVTFHGSRYAERLVIGDKLTLETAPHDALRRLYRDWYRPELMAVVAVGDFDPAAIEGLIRRHFSRIARSKQARPRVEYPIPDHAETLFSVVTDPEATSLGVTVGYKRPPEPHETVADLRLALVDDLYHGMMTARLGELAQSADPPFQSAFASSGSLGRTKSIYRLSARVADGGIERGLETLLTEARRVERHGFTETELARSKTQLLRRIDRQYEERDKQESGFFAGQYVRRFLEDDPAPSIAHRRDLLHRLVPGITLGEINARANQWISKTNRMILVSGPEKAEADIPDQAQLAAVFEDVERSEVTPWVDRVRDEPLVAARPQPGHVTEETLLHELGVTRWQLANGVTVLLKPTAFKNDEVLIRGFSPGGNSRAADEDYVSASLASGVVTRMGAGNFDQIELHKALAGKVASAEVAIGELFERVSGSASPQDLETLFQLLYLRFTGARRNEEAFQSYYANTLGRLQNQQASPEWWFGKKLSETLSQNHPRRRPLTVETLEQLDLERALAFYRDRFANASDFHFTIVGNFTSDSIRPLIETWIGGLPVTGQKESWRDVGVEAPPGVERFEVRKGIEPKSRVEIHFHGEAPWSPLDNHLIGSLAAVLRIRLREVLREDMGGVYGVGVSGSISHYPRQRYRATISFGCDPARVDELIAAALREIETIKSQGPGQEYVDKVREAQRRQRETDLERNSFWVDELTSHEIDGLDPRNILKYDALVAAVTVSSVQQAARRYLDATRYVQGVLTPEAAAAPGEAARD